MRSTSRGWSWESNLRTPCSDVRTPKRRARSGSACHGRIRAARYDRRTDVRARENPPLLPLSQHVAGTHSQMLDQDTKAAEHWLPTLQELAGRTSHEIKNALNGVAVNLEVLRSRLERGAGEGDAVAASVAPFARSASEQLDVLAEL